MVDSTLMILDNDDYGDDNTNDDNDNSFAGAGYHSVVLQMTMSAAETVE